MTKSTDGREWAHLSKVKGGDKLVADGGFTCVKDGEVVTLAIGADGHLGFPCADGEHDLSGQIDEDGDSLVGLWPA